MAKADHQVVAKISIVGHLQYTHVKIETFINRTEIKRIKYVGIKQNVERKLVHFTYLFYIVNLYEDLSFFF